MSPDRLLRDAEDVVGIVRLGDTGELTRGEMWDLLRKGERVAAHCLAEANAPTPVNMVLPCPRCGELHIDAPEVTNDPGRMSADALDAGAVEEEVWSNPPHRSHLCHTCGLVWRPADVPTNGVDHVRTSGKNDSPRHQWELRYGVE